MPNFFKTWKLFKIEHRYFYSESKYGILTLWSEEQAIAACYYIQCLKAELPHFENLYLDEDLLPSDMVILLSKLYKDCFAITGDVVYPYRSKLRFAASIDLYEIWEESPYSINLELVNSCVKKGVKQAITDLMYRSSFGDIRPRKEEYEADLKILKQIKEGVTVDKTQNLKNPSGEIYTGKIESEVLDVIL